MLRSAFVSWMVLVPLFLAAAGTAAAAGPTRVIFDTDLGADIDDALALAMIHALQARGDCRLVAVTLTNAEPRAAALVDAINTFYGHGDTPIGAARNGKAAASHYLETAELRDGDRLRYPRKVQSGKDLPAAVDVLRRVLAAQPDGSVVIAQVGLSSNLAALLQSGPDQASPLPGPELVKRKVKLLSVMGGAFVPIEGNARYAEYNIKSDLPASRRLAADWPTPIVWSGFEIGLAVPYPATSIEHDFGYVRHHPIADAYRLYEKMPYDRPSWDLTAVLYGLLPDRGYFDLSPPGRVTVDEDGATRFEKQEGGPHRYLILRPEQRGRVKEALVQLASQPPCAAAKEAR
ncbi:MAG TPA: nucleoside hydrolase [Gemmataceae bacterium]|nr:nucleoside hydrolase [Gemmataceae bacterium]